MKAAMMPAVWIVCVNYNGLTDTLKCLRSLTAAAAPDVVVVDNASTTDPRGVLASEFPDIHILRNDVNLGFAGGNNAGIRHALAHGAEWVLLLNNDTVVSPELLDRLSEAASAHPAFGIIGPVINSMDEPDAVMTDGCVFNDRNYAGFFQRRPVTLARTVPPTIVDVDIVNGCCMMISASVFKSIGFIDERFFLVHEESDFCLRARRAGFKCGVIGDVLVWHKGSSTFKRTASPLQRYYDARNLHLLLKKHGRAHQRGRGVAASWLQYLRHVYYLYALARERGDHATATAVLNGLYDALANRYGAYIESKRPGLALTRLVFRSFQQYRSARSRA
jgi:GT2 family glycosyltransferase